MVTVGPWVNELLPDLEWEVDIRRLVNAWFVPTAHDWHGAEAPTFIRTAPTHCYGLPSPDGISVKLGLSRALHRGRCPIRSGWTAPWHPRNSRSSPS